MPGIAAFRSGPLADFLDPPSRLCAGKTVEEQTLGVSGGKSPTALRAPGLKQDRGSLRRRLREVHAVHLEMLARVRDFMDAIGSRVDAVRRVAYNSVILPAAFPELVDDLHIFFGEVVAGVVIELSLKPHSACGA